MGRLGPAVPLWSRSEAPPSKVPVHLDMQVRLHALVTRVLFDSSKRAVGAEYMRGRSPTHSSPRLRVRARLSVVLCAGAIHTPKLLMLSGVGDEGHLRKHGIAPVQHSPHVGEGLADGVMSIMPCSCCARVAVGE